MAENDFNFPDDLRQAQAALHQTHAELRAAASELPWSVEPAEGWERPEGHWYPARRPATDGWTEEQKSAVAGLRARALELSVTVGTHPFWGTVAEGKVVEARMALKSACKPAEDADEDAAAEAA
ncbi:hypothetical protein ACSNOH_27680 [Streptomyces sp. URMC 127]|uniref:hypothetical protein n=1 Tax=Streptomyces sp. URMC 127 TaxID=3423402 RepID=UPI003F1DA92F